MEISHLPLPNMGYDGRLRVRVLAHFAGDWFFKVHFGNGALETLVHLPYNQVPLLIPTPLFLGAFVIVFPDSLAELLDYGVSVWVV